MKRKDVEKLEKDLKEATAKLEELGAWVESLSELDRMNFSAVIDMPNALTLLEKCPDQKFKEMGVLALALRKAGLK